MHVKETVWLCFFPNYLANLQQILSATNDDQRAVNPPTSLRFDREGMIDDVISHEK